MQYKVYTKDSSQKVYTKLYKTTPYLWEKDSTLKRKYRHDSHHFIHDYVSPFVTTLSYTQNLFGVKFTARN